MEQLWSTNFFSKQLRHSLGVPLCQITFPIGNSKSPFALRRQKELNGECVGMPCQAALVSGSNLITFNAFPQLYPLPCKAPRKEIATDGSWKRSCCTRQLRINSKNGAFHLEEWTLQDEIIILIPTVSHHKRRKKPVVATLPWNFSTHTNGV